MAAVAGAHTYGTAALGVAFGCVSLAAVEEFLDLGADPNIIPIDVHDRGPLEKILSFQRHNGDEDEKRRLNIVKFLVKNGADINRSTGNNFPCDCPPLWLAWLKYLRIAEYLLENGARTDIPIITKWPDNDGARYIIAALFAECDSDGFMGCIAEDTVQELEEAVVLLLQHGARIDKVYSDGGKWYEDADGDNYDTRDSSHYTDGDSALLYTCWGVLQNKPACLKMLLKHATRKNLSLEHLQEAIDTEFSDSDADSDDGTTDKNGEIQRKLADFMAREYPEAVSDDDT